MGQYSAHLLAHNPPATLHAALNCLLAMPLAELNINTFMRLFFENARFWATADVYGCLLAFIGFVDKISLGCGFGWWL